MKKIVLLVLFFTGRGFAAQDQCAQDPGVACNQDECIRCYCLGPENVIANAPTGPMTCNGDWGFYVAALYWYAHQDGMEFAIDTAVSIPVVNPDQNDLGALQNLIDSKYIAPEGSGNYGFKLGAQYISNCDGWDVSAIWTRFSTESFKHVKAAPGDNHVFIALWSAFASQHRNTDFARDIKSLWSVRLDLVDLELGREFWVSHLLSFRPFIGLRYGSLNQKLHLKHRGGSWSPRSNGNPQDPLNNQVTIHNNYLGFGIHSGFDGVFHLCSGWSIFSNLGASILCGRFKVDHDEQNTLAVSPYSKSPVLATEDHLRASRAILDSALGVEWSALFCNCKYGVNARLGFEQHLFLHQNQMWRVNRYLQQLDPLPIGNTGQNVHEQRRGSFSTNGVTLSLEIRL